MQIPTSEDACMGCGLVCKCKGCVLRFVDVHYVLSCAQVGCIAVQ